MPLLSASLPSILWSALLWFPLSLRDSLCFLLALLWGITKDFDWDNWLTEPFKLINAFSGNLGLPSRFSLKPLFHYVFYLKAQLKGHKAECHRCWGICRFPYSDFIWTSQLLSSRTCFFLLIFTDKVLSWLSFHSIYLVMYKNCTHLCTKKVYLTVSFSTYPLVTIFGSGMMAFGLNQIGSLSAFFAFDMLHKFGFN